MMNTRTMVVAAVLLGVIPIAAGAAHYVAPDHNEGKGRSLWSDSFKISGKAAEVGDEVGAFNKDNVLKGNATVKLDGWYGYMAVSGTNGDVLHLRVYDKSADKEYSVSNTYVMEGVSFQYDAARVDLSVDGELGGDATPTPSGTVVPVSTPTPPMSGGGLDVRSGRLVVGKAFSLDISLTKDLTRPFDFYILAAVPGGVYTIRPNGRVSAGIAPCYRGVPSFKAPYSLAIRSSSSLLCGSKGSPVVFHAVAVDAGTLPPVSSVDKLTAETANVILYGKNQASVQ